MRPYSSFSIATTSWCPLPFLLLSAVSIGLSCSTLTRPRQSRPSPSSPETSTKQQPGRFNSLFCHPIHRPQCQRGVDGRHFWPTASPTARNQGSAQDALACFGHAEDDVCAADCKGRT